MVKHRNHNSFYIGSTPICVNLFKKFMFVYSLLEQFEIIPIYSLAFGLFDFSITNSVFILFLIFLLIFFILKIILSVKDSSFF